MIPNNMYIISFSLPEGQASVGATLSELLPKNREWKGKKKETLLWIKMANIRLTK